jgi:hypothetical protein
MEVSDQTHVLATLSPGKSFRYTMNTTAYKPQSQSGRRDDKNIPAPNVNRNPAIQPVAARFTNSFSAHL